MKHDPKTIYKIIIEDPDTKKESTQNAPVMLVCMMYNYKIEPWMIVDEVMSDKHECWHCGGTPTMINKCEHRLCIKCINEKP